MLIQPMGDRVLVKRAKGKEMTDGGLIIPEASREKMGEGEVIAVGPGRPRLPVLLNLAELAEKDYSEALAVVREGLRGEVVPLAVKPGMRVLFSAFAGTPLELDETVQLPSAEHEGGGRRERVQYVLLREEEIVATIEGEGDVTIEPPVAPTPRD